MAIFAAAGAEFVVPNGTGTTTTDNSFEFGTAVTNAGANITRDTGNSRTTKAAASAKLLGHATIGFYLSIKNKLITGTLGVGGTTGYMVASQTLFFRGYIKISGTPSATTRIFRMNNLYVKLTTAGKLQLWDNTGTPAQIGSDSAATLNFTGTWYRIEVSWTCNATPQMTACELRLDGVTVASTSGLTHAKVADICEFGPADAVSTACTMWIDDITICDDQGTTNNTWLGDGVVTGLLAISDNARVGWTNGAAGTTNLFDDVDNTPPVGVASPSTQPSQIQRNASNTTDTYDANLTSYTTAGLDGTEYLIGIETLMAFGYSFAATSSMGMSMQSNPVITEWTASTFGANAVGTFAFNWTTVVNIKEYNATLSSLVTVGTSPVLRVRKNTSSASRSQYVCFMAALILTGTAPTSTPDPTFPYPEVAGVGGYYGT